MEREWCFGRRQTAVDTFGRNTYPLDMEIPLSPETAAKLSRIAAARGSDTARVAEEAIERFVDYDEWFLRAVQKGIDDADRGNLLSNEEVGTRLEQMLAKKQLRA